ncbi:MAG: hypothetical protein ACK4P2_06265 [Hyphomonas sp.]
MQIETMLGRALDLMPAEWNEGVKLAVLAGGLVLCLVVLAVVLRAVFGRKAAPKSAVSKPASGQQVAAAPQAKVPTGAAPDLDPEEWVSGNVIHYDRQRDFGYIRCDRVKGHVRFEAADFRRAPRVGETVRFKGRHGARRKPVADVVERIPETKRAG